MRVSVVVGRYARASEVLLRQAPRCIASEGRSDGVTCDDEYCTRWNQASCSQEY